MYLESVLINSCFSPGSSGCVCTHSCNVTMSNITLTGVSIFAYDSTVSVYNALARNGTVRSFWSCVSFWNLNISGTGIELDDSDAKFRHTLFVTQEETCPIKDFGRSIISLKSVYVTSQTKRAVCQGTRTVVYGSASGRTQFYSHSFRNKINEILVLELCKWFKR